MKKILFAIAVSAFVLAVSGCGSSGNVGSVKDSENGSMTVSEGASDSDSEAETISSEEAATEAETSVQEAVETKASQTTAADTTTASAQTAAVSTEAPVPTLDDEDEENVYAAAEALFEQACRTEWDFTVDSPYEIDPDQSIENDYGWQFYLVTDPEINSVADVRNDYHKVFSSDHDDYLDELFIESDGRVYCLNGARGSHIFYEGFELSEMERSDASISFKVTTNYSDDGFGGGEYSEENPFTVVKENGIWKVDKFKLPY